jgi:hypothetical protein
MQKKMMMRNMFILVAALAAFLGASPAIAQDVVTVGGGSALPGATIDIPVSIRDVSGTSLGIDQPAGSRIQSYSIKVDYAPAAAIQSITFTRGGITTSLTPAFESSPSGAGTVSLIDSFAEASNLIPFTLNAPAPGTQVGVLHVRLSTSAVPGTAVALTLDPVLTQLTDQAGSGGTKETVSGGNLTLVNGILAVVAPLPTLSTWALLLLVVALSLVAVRAHS